MFGYITAIEKFKVPDKNANTVASTFCGVNLAMKAIIGMLTSNYPRGT